MYSKFQKTKKTMISKHTVQVGSALKNKLSKLNSQLDVLLKKDISTKNRTLDFSSTENDWVLRVDAQFIEKILPLCSKEVENTLTMTIDENVFEYGFSQLAMRKYYENISEKK